MSHPEAGTARFPRSAVQHWSGHGWTECEPPEKPPRPQRRTGKPQRPRARRPQKPVAEPVKSTPVDAQQDGDKKPSSAKTQKAPSGRKED